MNEPLLLAKNIPDEKINNKLSFENLSDAFKPFIQL